MHRLHSEASEAQRLISSSFASLDGAARWLPSSRDGGGGEGIDGPSSELRRAVDLALSHLNHTSTEPWISLWDKAKGQDA